MFFASYCGLARSRVGGGLEPTQADEEADLRCLSVREAVNFAKSTNLLGVILEATTLVPFLFLHIVRTLLMFVCQAAVPSLVASVKDAGLLLATFGQLGDVTALRQGASDGRTVDAFVIDG